MNVPYEDLLTISEASRVLGMSRQRVWQLIKAKTIPAHRVGRTLPWLIKAEDLREHITNKVKVEEKKA